MQTLPEMVREFISLLDKVEISDNDREFRPNYISSCRVMDGKRMGELLMAMKATVNSEVV